jgi:hypothetical protein
MRSLRSIGAAVLFTPAALAQSVYVDFGVGTPPSSNYGAAAGIPGHWNAMPMPISNAPLLGTQGEATSLIFHASGCDSGSEQFPTTRGDDEALLDDWFYGDCAFSTETVTITGFAAGAYMLYAYPLGNGTGFVISANMSPPLAQDGSGVLLQQTPFPGTYAGWQVVVLPVYASQSNATLFLTYSSSAVGFSGIQLVRTGDAPWTGSMFCFADGSTSVECPCNNQGVSGHGCANLLYDAGAQLTATGTASVSADTVVLKATAMSGAQSWYFQSTEQAAQPWGYGLLCMSGALLRVGQKALVNGSSTNPSGTDFPLSVKGAIPPSGGTRHYQVSYRQANPPCTPAPTSNTNRTNGVTIVWTP